MSWSKRRVTSNTDLKSNAQSLQVLKCPDPSGSTSQYMTRVELGFMMRPIIRLQKRIHLLSMALPALISRFAPLRQLVSLQIVGLIAQGCCTSIGPDLLLAGCGTRTEKVRIIVGV